MEKQTRAYISLIYVCIVWGTTYLAIRIGVLGFGAAFLFAGLRQFFAGIILMTIALAMNKQKDLSWKNVSRQMLVGFLMLSLGNGCVTWGEKAVPSGIAALICSMMPIFAVTFNLIGGKKEKFNLTTGIGMLLGTCGIGFIFRNDLEKLTNSAYLLGMFAILCATSSWALGSVINKNTKPTVNPFFNSGLQLFFGGFFMIAASPFTDNYRDLNIYDRNGIFSLIYLTIFGSVLAYTAYMYALSKLPVGIATIYAYINPLIAVLLGGWLRPDEHLNFMTLLAFGTIILSVYLVNRGYRLQTKLTSVSEGSEMKTPFPENIPVES
jgi:drug/metabolite transporter (DMT)-like permease